METKQRRKTGQPQGLGEFARGNATLLTANEGPHDEARGNKGCVLEQEVRADTGRAGFAE